MFNILSIFISLLVYFFPGFLFAQEFTRKDYQPPLRSDYVSGRVDDDRFLVTDFNYLRKFSPTGKGEVLEVMFDINNKTESNIDFKMYILGFLEENKVSDSYRQLVPYPHWRKKDLDKDKFGIVLVDSLPKINPSLITKDYFNESSTYQKIDFPYAGFIPYLKYIDKNSSLGVDVKLLGLEKSVSFANNDYKFVSEKYKTTVSTEFFFPYRRDIKFFDTIGIILYDTGLNRIVYRQFYKMKKIPKIH